ncbi:hypothetical protein [Ascidiaceihabitans sp.]|uniref:hypothetical protein n=1 Tax=Ascidiaceihabitans sp. TaxID=1872644 RepID=UPI0032998F42
MARFGAVLPAIRRKIASGIARDDLSEDFTVAVVLRLIDHASLRVGTPDYAAETRRSGQPHYAGAMWILTQAAADCLHNTPTIARNSYVPQRSSPCTIRPRLTFQTGRKGCAKQSGLCCLFYNACHTQRST